MALKNEAQARSIGISFEFFPPKSEEMEGQLWNTVSELQDWDPDFVSVTDGAGGTTKAPTLTAVTRFLSQTPLATASHLTCVGATKEETHHMIETFRKVGVTHFVALRGDAPGGAGETLQLRQVLDRHDAGHDRDRDAGPANPLQIALEIVVVEEELCQRPVGAVVGLALQHVDIGSCVAALRMLFRIGRD